MRVMSIALPFCLVTEGCNLMTIQAGITNGIGVIENVVGHRGFEDKLLFSRLSHDVESS